MQKEGVLTQQQKSKEAERQLSAEERAMKFEIKQIEKHALQKVFVLLCGNGKKDGKEQIKELGKDYFSEIDVARVLNDLDYQGTKQEIDQMIWEIDENLNGRIDEYEFDLMYKRCSQDESGLEPKSLYNVVQFLMFLQKNNQADDDSNHIQNKKTITSEDTLELLYVRHGRFKLDQEIEEIFGRDNMIQDGQEKAISLTEYLQKIKKKDFKTRKAMEKKRLDVDPDKKDRDADYYYRNV